MKLTCTRADLMPALSLASKAIDAANRSARLYGRRAAKNHAAKALAALTATEDDAVA